MDNINETLENAEFVGFWRRVGASLLDIAVLLPLVILYILTYRYFIANQMAIPLILYYVLIFSYYIFFIVKYGGTPGKLILKYRIVNSEGNFLSIPKVLIRETFRYPQVIAFLLMNFLFTTGPAYMVISIIDNIFMVIYLFDVLIVTVTSRKRAIHDYMADSYVITKESWQRGFTSERSKTINR